MNDELKDQYADIPHKCSNCDYAEYNEYEDGSEYYFCDILHTCTHSFDDCRCGRWKYGNPFAKKLNADLEENSITTILNDSGLQELTARQQTVIGQLTSCFKEENTTLQWLQAQIDTLSERINELED